MERGMEWNVEWNGTWNGMWNGMWNGTWNGTWNRMAHDLPRIRTYSFPGLHAQLLSLAVLYCKRQKLGVEAWERGYTYI